MNANPMHNPSAIEELRRDYRRRAAQLDDLHAQEQLLDGRLEAVRDKLWDLSFRRDDLQDRQQATWLALIKETAAQTDADIAAQERLYEELGAQIAAVDAEVTILREHGDRLVRELPVSREAQRSKLAEMDAVHAQIVGSSTT